MNSEYEFFLLQLDTFAGGMSSYFGGGNDKSKEEDEEEPYAGKFLIYDLPRYTAS